MSQIKIEWAESKTSTAGTVYKRATVIENGNTIDNVAVFASFPQYSEVEPGRTVEGFIKIKDYKGKPSYSLESGMKPASKDDFGRNKGIKEAQDRKELSIDKSQDRKEHGIKVSSTLRMAVDLSIAFPDQGDEGTEDQIKKWREWLWGEWDKEDSDFKPF